MYTKLTNLLDPITQLMIYYRQGDMDMFNDSDKFNNTQRFLTMFLLNKMNKIKEYIPDENYLPFIDMLDGKVIPQDILDQMLFKMSTEGSHAGVKLLEKDLEDEWKQQTWEELLKQITSVGTRFITTKTSQTICTGR